MNQKLHEATFMNFTIVFHEFHAFSNFFTQFGSVPARGHYGEKQSLRVKECHTATFLQMGLRNERVSHLADAASSQDFEWSNVSTLFSVRTSTKQDSRTGRMMPSNKAINNEAKSRPVVVALD